MKALSAPFITDPFIWLLFTAGMLILSVIFYSLYQMKRIENDSSLSNTHIPFLIIAIILVGLTIFAIAYAVLWVSLRI